ncbi:putative short-chain type dehydrogenase/reductase [Rhodococcus erythropolis]|uniref:mycofactocin-coupled SDR family oxidoreductase n=1 Tax=Rhodococcus erythropolis TaxID=1833 RepID=UPI000BB3D103|nr:mycofactocin-coupled SDR family oxidoreductase [Rhodococcus erythropolis]PBI88069.1 putative short-chain type dehydrogenase/reductase [Rhodococcus erythropolis]
MTGRLEGKVAFITGAGRGQGRSHAIRLAQEGADIIAIDACEDIRDLPHSLASKDDLAHTAKEVESLRRRIITRKVDVRDFEGLQAAVAAGISEFGRLDVVSANAGIGTYAHKAHDLPEHIWQDMIDVNLTGVWHTCKAAIPAMINAGNGGSIVLTSSCAGLAAYQNMVHYNAAKHGVVGIMRTLANELGNHMIRVNSIHPAFTDAEIVMNQPTFDLFCPHLEKPDRDDLAKVSQTMNILPIPWLEPVDMSNALLFLASDEARYITGVTLPIDAGLLTKVG